MLERWEGRETLDLAAEMSRLTLRIAGETLFSMDVSGESGVVSQALDAVLSGFIRSVTNPLARYLPLPSTIRSRRAAKELDSVVRGIISRRRKEGGERDDLLGMFMGAKDEQTGEGMDDEQLRDEVLTMLLAGHETTANALAWTLFELSQNPEVTRKLEEEVDTVMGQAPFSMEHLGGLTWTEQVLKESLRLHPPAWIESRKCLEDDTVGGYHLPAGSFVFVCQYVIHRHPRFWTDPLQFSPDRFGTGPQLCPDGSPRPRLAWFPFGAGQRKCIGEHFAMLESKILTALIARRYRFELQPGWEVRPEPTVTLRPRGGLPMRIRKR
jgi:cytochrome P450